MTCTKKGFSIPHPFITCNNNVVVECLVDISIDHERLVIILIANGVRVEETWLCIGTVVDAIGTETGEGKFHKDFFKRYFPTQRSKNSLYELLHVIHRACVF